MLVLARQVTAAAVYEQDFSMQLPLQNDDDLQKAISDSLVRFTSSLSHNAAPIPSVAGKPRLPFMTYYDLATVEEISRRMSRLSYEVQHGI